MARKAKQEECPAGAPAWMVTYGDMMTLLLTFFVLIVSMSSIEQVKFKAAISSIQDGMGMWPNSQGMMQKLQLDEQIKQATETQEMIEDLVETLEQLGMEQAVEIYNTPNGVRMIIADPMLFESGSAILQDRFKILLGKIAEIINRLKYDEIRVEGHTDNVPINTPKYPSNWELSAGRALTVTRYMAFQGHVKPENLSAVGYGEFRPRESNDTPAGRAKNRRVEIFLERKPKTAEF